MNIYDDIVMRFTYEDAILLKESINGLNISDSFKKMLENGIEYSERKNNRRDFLKILRIHKEAELDAFYEQNLTEFRENGGNYAYSTGKEFDAFIKSKELNSENLKIFSGFFVSRFDPDEYEWSAALVYPSINLIAVSYGGSKISYAYLTDDEIKKYHIHRDKWIEFNKGE